MLIIHRTASNGGHIGSRLPTVRKSIVNRKLDDLHPYPRQAEMFSDLSDHDLQMLMDGMNEEPFYDPVEITSSDVIISGHQRVRAAKPWPGAASQLHGLARIKAAQRLQQLRTRAASGSLPVRGGANGVKMAGRVKVGAGKVSVGAGGGISAAPPPPLPVQGKVATIPLRDRYSAALVHGGGKQPVCSRASLRWPTQPCSRASEKNRTHSAGAGRLPWPKAACPPAVGESHRRSHPCCCRCRRALSGRTEHADQGPLAPTLAAAPPPRPSLCSTSLRRPW